MTICKVEKACDLQNLVTHTILVEPEPFSPNDIVTKVMKNELFNNFCLEKPVFDMVCSTINMFLLYSVLDMYDNKYFVR